MARSKNNKKELKKVTEQLSDKGLEIISFKTESQAPIVSERIQKQKPWVYFGEDNLWPNKLIEMADNSALHSSILDTKAKMIAGDGILYEGEDASQAEAEKFLEDSTADFGGLNRTIQRLSTDVAYFNSFYLNVQYNNGGEVDTLRHLDYSFVRSGKMDLTTRKVHEYYMSTRWDIATTKRTYSPDDEIYKPIEILAFDPKKMRDKSSRASGQLVVARTYDPSVLYYTKPTYIGCVNQIEVAAKIANFHKNQLDNGMTGNLHLHLKQDLSDTTKRVKMLKELNAQYAGTNNAGRIFLTWGVGESNIPEVNTINTSDVHGALSELNTRTNEEIAMAHQISRSIVGLDQSTGLGGLEISNALDMFQTVYVSPSQQLIEDTLNDLLKFNNINATVKIERLRPSTLVLSDTLMSLSATVNEIREIANLGPFEDEEIGNTILKDIENGSRAISGNTE